MFDYFEENMSIERPTAKMYYALVKLSRLEAQRQQLREKHLKFELERFEWAKEVDDRRLAIEEQRVKNKHEERMLEMQLKYKK
ncbi:GH24230 [Drosophila grimshawi]|uniref:GH24230 n=2 Tax=Drosophila grimshawi TaxID=7222 RepID=B4JN04_DROGR|nr:GH24230 [Drosophila grimshawi]